MVSDTKHFSTSGVVIHDGKVLLVRHTYGVVKNKLLIPGGYVQNDELVTDAVVREIYEETKVTTQVCELIAMRFMPNNWWAIFSLDYVSGIPMSDGKENSEAIFIDVDKALESEEVTDGSKQAIKAVLDQNKQSLRLSDWCPPRYKKDTYRYFGKIL